MKRVGFIVLSGVLLLAGCAASPAKTEADEQYEKANANCIAMAQQAMPNGMADPDQPSAVLGSVKFCERLAGGYSREKFAELYNDPEWLASELSIWTGEGLP